MWHRAMGRLKKPTSVNDSLKDSPKAYTKTFLVHIQFAAFRSIPARQIWHSNKGCILNYVEDQSCLEQSNQIMLYIYIRFTSSGQKDEVSRDIAN